MIVKEYRVKKESLNKWQFINTDYQEVQRRYTISQSNGVSKKYTKFNNRNVFHYHTEHSHNDREYGISVEEYKVSERVNKIRINQHLTEKRD